MCFNAARYWMSQSLLSMNSSLCTESSSTIAEANSSADYLSQQCVHDFFLYSLYDFLQMFYIVWPSENTYESGHDVPNYELNVKESTSRDGF